MEKLQELKEYILKFGMTENDIEYLVVLNNHDDCVMYDLSTDKIILAECSLFEYEVNNEMMIDNLLHEFKKLEERCNKIKSGECKECKTIYDFFFGV